MAETGGRLHMDAAGRFPTESALGQSYHLIFFCEDANYIHVETMGNREAVSYLQAYQRGTDFFRNHGIVPRYLRTDNELSTVMSNYCLRQVPRITIEQC